MDFEQARFNMIEQQIRPWNVLDAKVLELMFHVKREDFVLPEQRPLAFTDVQLPLGNGTFMLEPKQEARMVQDLQIQPNDNVLELGTGSGYVTALLASLSAKVFSIETDAKILEQAVLNLAKAKIKNAELLLGNGLQGLEEHAPFDVIFVGGSLPSVPEVLKNQLAIGGRLLLTTGAEPAMQVCRIDRKSETLFVTTVLYEACIPRLQGCEALELESFVF